MPAVTGAGRCSAWGLGFLVMGVAIIYCWILDASSVPGGMDFFNLMWPHAELVRSGWCAGRVPLWNWWSWGGAPLMAAWLPAVWYPPMWLALCLPLPWGLQALIVAHIAWAGAGAALLARATWRVGPVGCAIAGLAFAGSGFFVGRVEQVINVAGMAWMPWIVWSLLIVARESGSWPVAASVATMGLLAGHPQFAVLAYLFGGIWVGCVRLVEVGWSRDLLRAGVACMAGVGLGILLAAAQIVPSLELITVSERAVGVGDAFTPQLDWNHLWSLVVPRYLNALTNTSGKPVPFSELSLYIGVSSLALAGIGAATIGAIAPRKQRAVLLVTVGIAVLALAFSLGTNTPLAGAMRDIIPGLSSVRGSARATGIVLLMLSVLAGAGAHWLVTSGLKSPWVGMLAWVLPVFVLVELAMVHATELRSAMVSGTLADMATSTPAQRGRDSAVPVPRTYRFQRDDGNYYVDGSPAAVLRRVERGQPAINVLRRVGYLDGYEEGLLPTLPYANFLRRFNRNLRNDRLDGALLWLMGSSLISTEYPLRPDGLQALAEGSKGGFLRFRTEYRPILIGTTSDDDGAWGAWVSAYGRVGRGAEKESMNTVVRNHPLFRKSPSEVASYVKGDGIQIHRMEPNALIVNVPAGREASHLVLFASAYPGWKMRTVAYGGNAAKGPWFPMDTAASVVMRGELPHGDDGDRSAAQVFEIRLQSFSVLLGTFLTLVALGGFLSHLLLRRRWRQMGLSALERRAHVSK